MSDLHQHYCRQCRAPWEHDGDQMTSNEQIKAEHKCPKCGTLGWVKYYGNETHDEMCELEALLELADDERVPERTRSQAQRDFSRMARRLHRPGEPPSVMEELLDAIHHYDGALCSWCAGESGS